jgi:uncharacterized protein with ParB-like and HNH nuclease domain
MDGDEIIFDDDSDTETIVEHDSDFKGLNSYTVGNSIRTIIDMIDENIIDLSPEFQRDFVWDMRRASKLIDSLLISLPIPNIMLGKYQKTENFIVIDGQQRLKSIYYYVKGVFRENGKERDFKLRGLEDKSWNGKLFSELDPVLQKRILNSVINSTILDNIDSTPRIVFEIFNRLNTGGIPLNNQEVRNCIFGGRFNEELKELNKISEWRHLVKKPIPDKRMTDVELILRFFSLYNQKYMNYKPPMREWLNDEMRDNQTGLESFDEFKKVFEETVRKIHDEIGINVFKGKGRSFNRSIFDAVMVSFAMGIRKNNFSTDLYEKYNNLLNDSDFNNFIIEGTTASKKVRGRINLAIDYFLE